MQESYQQFNSCYINEVNDSSVYLDQAKES